MNETRKQLTIDLVNILINKGMIKTERVRDVMLKIDRGHFWGTDPNNLNIINKHSYENSPQSINFNVVISAPNLHAYVLELLSDVL